MNIDFLPNPLTSEGREQIVVVPGITVEALLANYLPLPDIDFMVSIDGMVIPKGQWPEIRITRDCHMQVRVAPLDGPGSNPIATILQLGLLVAAPHLSGVLQAAGLSAAWASGVTAIAVAGGILALNAIFPPRLPEITTDEEKRAYTLSAGGNRARPHQPFLLVLGQHRVFPDLIAKPYSEFSGSTTAIVRTKPVQQSFGGDIDDPFGPGGRYIGDDQVVVPPQSQYVTVDQTTEEHVIHYNEHHLYQLFDFGIGTLRRQNHRLGETPLTSFDAVDTQASTTNITLVDGNVDTIQGAELEFNTAVERRTAKDTKKIVFHLISRNFELNDENEVVGGTNTFLLEYRRVGAATWEEQTVEMPSPNGTQAREVTRRAFGYAVTAGQYDVRVTLITEWDTSNESLSASATLFVINAHQTATANLSGRNPYALKIRATGQLYGRVENLSADISQLIPVWDGTQWLDDQATSNPAWIMRAFWRGWYRPSDGKLMAGRGLDNNQIDDESLQLWGAFCDANSLRCDLVIDSAATDADIEQLIAQCGWASVSKATGKRGVIWENDNQPVSVVFNPANIVAGSMRIEYQNEGLADEVVGTFVDRDSDYGQNTIRRLVEGVLAPSRSVTVPLRGITSGGQAAKELNRMAAAQYYHQRHITWEASAEGGPLFVTRGDVVGLGHDLAGGTVGGRLTGLGTARTALMATIALPASGMVWIWGLDGDIHVTAFTRSTADVMVMNIAVALPSAPSIISDDPSAYRFVAFADGVSPRKVRITGVEHSRSGYYKFTARDEIALYYNARSADLSFDLLPDRSLYRPVNTDTPPLDIEGQRWHFGGGVPATTLGSNGNYYLRVTTNQIYLKRGGLWTVIANLSGADQAQWHVGAGVPPDTLGSDNDLYFRVGTAGQIYQKAGGSWSILLELRGGTWLAGAGLPDSSLGNIGDLYYRTSNGFTYEKKTDTFWEFLRDLTGPGIDSVVRNDQTGIVTITFRSGETDTFTLADGEDGDDGASVEIDTTLGQPNGDVVVTFSDGTSITIPAGTEGKGIDSIIRNEETGVVTVTLDDGTTRFYTATSGRDGKTKEFIYRRTETDTPPTIPTEPANTDPPWSTRDDFVPTGWTDNQTGVDSTNIREWQLERRGSTENWGAFENLVPLARYVELPANLIGNLLPWVTGRDYRVGDAVLLFEIVTTETFSYTVPVVYQALLDHSSSEANKPGIIPPRDVFLCTDDAGDELWELDPDGADSEGTNHGSFISGLDDPVGGAYYDSRIFICNSSGANLTDERLYEVLDYKRPGDSSQVINRGAFPNAFEHPVGMTVHDGRLVAVSNDNDPFEVRLWEITNPNNPGGATNRGLVGSLNSADALVSFNGQLLVFRFLSRDLWLIPSITNAAGASKLSTLPSGMSHSAGAVVYDGRLIVAVFGSGLWQITNPSTGAATKLRNFPTGLGSAQGLLVARSSAEQSIYWKTGADIITDTGGLTSTPPPAPQNFSVEAVGTNRLDLLWDAPVSGTRPFTYRVECSESSAFPSDATAVLTPEAGQTGTQYYDTAVVGGTEYFYRVRAMGPGGTSPWSATESDTTLLASPKPSVPQNVSIVAVGQSVTLSWDAPSTGSPFTKYEVESALNDTFTLGRYISSASGTATDSVFTGTGSTTYYVRVRAVNAQGNGPWSATLSATTGAVGVPPTAVIDLSAAVASDTEINLSWDEPTGGDLPIRYQVDRATDAAFTENLDTRANNRTQSDFPDTGLTASTRYYYRVRGENTTGDGPWRTVSAVTQATPINAPGVPVATLSFTVLRSVDVSWDAISGADTYDIQVSTSSAFPVGTETRNETGLTGTSKRITALTSGTTYYVRMRSVNAGGNSAWSAVVSGSTVQISVPPVSLNASISGDDDVNLIWSHPIFPPDLPTGVTWRIQRADDAEFSDNLTTLATAQVLSDRTYTDSDRPAGTYYYRVRGEVAGAGNGEWRSVVVNVALPDIIPSAPQNFVADPPGVTGISFTWDAPAVGRPTNYQYTLEVATNSAFTENLQTHQVNHVTGLTGGTTYYARVRAANSAGTSPWSNTLSVTTDTFALPSVPRNFIAYFIPGTPGRMILDWDSPANGDTPITYEGERATDEDFTTDNITLFSDRTFSSYQDLDPDSGRYYYRVRASNTGGDSPWTPTLSRVVP